MVTLAEEVLAAVVGMVAVEVAMGRMVVGAVVHAILVVDHIGRIDRAL